MTVAEMHFEFQILLETMWDEFKETERPDSFTVLKYLNLAQDRYIKDKYLSNPNMKANVEMVQKKTDDLRNIIKRDTRTVFTAIATGPSNRYLISLPDDYLFYIRADIKITRSDLPAVIEEWTPVRVTDYDEVYKITTGIYNKPILPEPVIVFEESDNIVIYKDDYTTLIGPGTGGGNLELTYLRQPYTMVIDGAGIGETITCELAEHTHEEITRIAVEMFTMEYKFRLQTKKSEA